MLKLPHHHGADFLKVPPHTSLCFCLPAALKQTHAPGAVALAPARSKRQHTGHRSESDPHRLNKPYTTMSFDVNVQDFAPVCDCACVDVRLSVRVVVWCGAVLCGCSAIWCLTAASSPPSLRPPCSWTSAAISLETARRIRASWAARMQPGSEGKAMIKSRVASAR